MRKTITLFGLLLFLFGCNPAEKKQKNTFDYFDLKGYFANESSRLNKSNPLLTKTVEVNGTSETKKIRLADWAKELAVFSDADINKNAWKGLFDTKNTEQQLLYTSNNKKISVKEVLVVRRNKEVHAIRILVSYDNMLYSSADTLSYYPDSLYQIRKKQKIRLLSEKSYIITGRLK